MEKVANSAIELIGKTPLVELHKLTKEACALARVLVKVEAFNPAGSVKDRVALAMVEQAERDGILKPGATIVEPTSGNTGAGLSNCPNVTALGNSERNSSALAIAPFMPAAPGVSSTRAP